MNLKLIILVSSTFNSPCNLVSFGPLIYLTCLWVFSLGALRHSLQERLSKGAGVHSSGKIRADEIYLKLRTSTGKISILTFLV